MDDGLAGQPMLMSMMSGCLVWTQQGGVQDLVRIVAVDLDDDRAFGSSKRMRGSMCSKARTRNSALMNSVIAHRRAQPAADRPEGPVGEAVHRGQDGVPVDRDVADVEGGVGCRRGFQTLRIIILLWGGFL